MLIDVPTAASQDQISYELCTNRSLRTASVGGQLDIAGKGIFTDEAGNTIEYRHCPTALANLLPTLAITRSGARIYIAFDVNLRREQ